MKKNVLKKNNIWNVSSDYLIDLKLCFLLVLISNPVLQTSY